MTERSACLCCGTEFAPDAAQESLGDRRKGLQGTWRVLECRECGSMSMAPAPTDAELAVFYAAYTTDEVVNVRSGFGSRHPGLRRLYHRFSGDVDPRDFVTVPAGAKVLDYGSGQGTYLQDFHARGVDISGAEITDTLVGACRAQGLKIQKVDDFDTIPFADGSFDVVYLMQVFEHLRNPRAFMAELARILKPGGALYLAVPNADSMWRRVFGANWVSGWFAPFHLVHYRSRTLSRLASAYGLEEVTTWSRTPESWFRLNLKALMYPGERRLDSFHCWMDKTPFRQLVTVALRVCGLFAAQRDCLAMKFERR